MKISKTIITINLLSTVLLLMLFSSVELFAQKTRNETYKNQVKFTLNAYSFDGALTGKEQYADHPNFSLLDLVDWCSEQKIEALDLTGYYFPGYPEVPTDEYIYNLKKRCFKQGVDISGIGVRNFFSSPDPIIRAKSVELVKKWILVAEKIGAPVIRTFAGAVPTGYENKFDEVYGWMLPLWKECIEFGKIHGVIVGIQNHNDMIRNSDDCIKIMNGLKSEWTGIIIDTGNFKDKDPYVGVETVIPFACNWQVKESMIGNSSFEMVDFDKLVKIIMKSNYKGYVPLETIKKDKSYNPFTRVPWLLKQLNDAKDKVLNVDKKIN